MKKITVVLVTLMLLFSTITFAVPSDDIQVFVNNIPLVFDVNPTIIDGRTVLPVRAIFESLGLEVGWDDTTKTVTGTSNGIVIKLQIDQVKATINGKEFILDVPATVINGRTLVPARFVAEATGATVGWDAVTRTISIDKSLTKNGIAIQSVAIISVGLETEEVVIKNSSTESVQMKGYKLVSVIGNQVYIFPDYLLEAGKSVTVYSGKGSGDLKWTGSYIWNNDGDPAELYDPNGNLISSF